MNTNGKEETTISKKKIFLSVIAVMLMAAISVCGTLAYLTKDTGPVVNTFLSAGDLIDEGDNAGLWLKEKAVTTDSSGRYSVVSGLSQENYFTHESWVGGIHYDKVMPGLTLPKEAAVNVVHKNPKSPAYLYIEVCNGLSAVLTYTPKLTYDAYTWTEISDFLGPNRGKVYCLYQSGAPLIVTQDIYAEFNATVEVDPQCDPADITGSEVTYYAYLAQASAGNGASEVFEACFDTSEPEMESGPKPEMPM